MVDDAEDEALRSLASAVLDGAAPDWSAADSGGDPRRRAVSRQLRVLSEIIAAHREAGASVALPASSAGLPESLGTWGPLQLLECVGTGTFGDVYRAWDARLNREVALKLLRTMDASNADDTTAIVEEGRLLAQVRHEHVLTVYGAERHEGRLGIWTEFIRGETLEARVRTNGPLPDDEVVVVGRAICRALTAVHAAGTLHRDVKASNVMREHSGRIVLMDFGTGSAAIDARADLSGTPLYLAPELFTGAAPTVASDLYAVAVLLFHLLTDTYPVEGETLDDVRRAHARSRSPRPMPIRSRRLAAIIGRGLDPDPRLRFGSAEEFEHALDAVDPTRRAERARARQRRTWTFLAGGTVLVAGLSAWLLTRRESPFESSWVSANYERLTTSGDASRAAVSSDGRTVAYLQGVDTGVTISGPRRVILRTLASGREVSLEESDRPLAPTFTPNGQALDVLESGKLNRITLSSGAARVLISDIASAPGWSPDGTQMAFVRRNPIRSQLVVADDQGLHERILAEFSGNVNLMASEFTMSQAVRPAWSPDGRSLAVSLLDLNLHGVDRILIVDVSTGHQREIGRVPQPSLRQPELLDVAWVDGAHLIVDRDSADHWGIYQLWMLDVIADRYTPITRDFASYEGLSVTRDSHSVLSTRRPAPATGIWLRGPAASEAAPAVAISTAYPRLGSVSDHGDLAYWMDSADGPAIWLLAAGTAKPSYLTTGWNPTFTPTGDAVVFIDGGDRAGLYRIDPDGSHRVKLVDGIVGGPFVVAPNGDVIFWSRRSGVQSLWRVPVNGGTAEDVTRLNYRRYFGLTPDGRQVLFTSASTGEVVIACDIQACAPRPFPVQPSADFVPPIRMVHGGFFGTRLDVDGGRNLWRESLTERDLRPVTSFSDLKVDSFAISPDGRWLAVARGPNPSSDVVRVTRGSK